MDENRKNDNLEKALSEMKSVYWLKVNDDFTGIVIKKINDNAKEVYLYINYVPVLLGIFAVVSLFTCLFFAAQVINDINASELSTIFSFFNNVNLGTFITLTLSSIPYTSIILLVINIGVIGYIYKKTNQLFRKNV